MTISAETPTPALTDLERQLIDAMFELYFGWPQERQSVAAVPGTTAQYPARQDAHPLSMPPEFPFLRVGGRGTGRPAKSRTEPKRKAARSIGPAAT